MDIIYSKKNVIVSAKIEVDNGLICQVVFLMNPKTIILIIIPTIIFIEDQKKELK